VYNKIGSQLVAETASNYHIPLYVCTDSWKFDPMSYFGFEQKIEERHKKEVWNINNKNIKISNYAFEIVNPKYIGGFFCEFGILSLNDLKNFFREEYPDLFIKIPK